MNDDGYFLAIDIGGTFTDLVLARADGGRLEAVKVLTTPRDPTEAVFHGVRELLHQARVRPDQVERVVHATTLATNLILEGKGPPVAYVSTAGFGDVPRIGRETRTGADRYDLFFKKPLPPVPDDLIYEVPERVDAQGKVVEPLDEGAAEAVAYEIARRVPVAVAVCLLHSYANSVHERQLAGILRRVMPEIHLALSSEVWPEIGEYDRALTTIMSAYVGPVLAGYVTRLARGLGELEIPAPLEMMQSNGGIMTAAAAARRAIYSVESGPAAGVVAVSYLSGLYQQPNAISFDMGGTTAKAGVVRRGEPSVTNEYLIGGGASHSSRHGSGFPIRIPVIDLAEVGAGGGSIAWVDRGGIMQVGPQSAGSDPGAACYGFGGVAPTVTDADLLLGYLDPSYFLGGKMAVSVARAEEAIRRDVADPLGLDVTAAANGIFRIANANMADAIRVVTVQRGIDPRDFTIFGFGGAGPVHMARIAEEFDIPRIVIPAMPGVLAAIGLLASELATDSIRTWIMDATRADTREIMGILEELEAVARAELAEQGVDSAVLTARYAIDVRFKHQSHGLTIPLSDHPAGRGVRQVSESFYDLYRERYGIDRRDPIEFVNFRVRLIGRVHRVQFPFHATRPGTGQLALMGARPAYFPESNGYTSTPVYDRQRLVPGDILAGPAIIQSPDSTVLAPPNYEVTVDGYANLLIEHPAVS